MDHPPKSEDAEQLLAASRILQSQPLRKTPLHVQIRESLRQLIQDKFQPGDKFFSEPELIKQLGVSQGTVRRALTDLSREGLLVRRVPQGTFVAENPAEGHSVGVFMPQYDSPFLMEFLEHISKVCRTNSVPVTIHQTHRGEEIHEALAGLNPNTAQERVLLLGETPETSLELYRNLSRKGYRVINVDTLLDGCGDAYVGVDNTAGIHIGMDHLMELGHRRITLLVNETLESGNIRERRDVFEAYCRDHGLTEGRIVESGITFWADSLASAYAQMEEVMSVPEPPTAILTVSAAGAWGALKWLQQKRIDVPSEVSLLSFDDTPTNRFMHPAITSITQPIAGMAHKVIDLVCQDELGDNRIHLLAPGLEIRESCAALDPSALPN